MQYPSTTALIRVLFLLITPLAATWAADTAIAAPAATNLPAGWTAADIGTVRKPGAVTYDAATKAFTIRTIGETAENRGTFAYTAVKGDFVATCRVTAASPAARC